MFHLYLGGNLVAIREASTAEGVVTRYQHTDALGSPVAITNEAGVVVERNNYEPYGSIIGKPNYGGVGFTGHLQDAATGLTYMQQRYYDPALGRFLSVDPVAANPNTGASFNRYVYASNNPCKFTDPDGRSDMNLFGEQDPNGLRSAGAAFNMPGWFTVTTHANPSIIQDQRDANNFRNMSASDSWLKATNEFGLRQGMNIFMAGCHLGAEYNGIKPYAQAWANLNKSDVYASNGFVMYPKNFKEGSDLTLRVNMNEDGKGAAGVFRRFSSGGNGPVGREIRTVTIKANGNVHLKYATPEIGTRIPRTEIIKLK